MKQLVMITSLVLGLGQMLNAQVTTGTLMGKVCESDSVTALPGAKVWIDTETGPLGVMCDVEGRYKIDGVKPGIYTVHAKFTGLGEFVFNEVKLTPDGITNLDFAISRTLEPVVVIWKPKLITHDIVKVTILTEDIEHSPYIRDPKGLLAATQSDIKIQDGTGDIIIRGSRPGDAIYYVDGVKATDMSMVPGAAIGSMEAYTGGIPAKYGDTTGGVVILETKSYFDLYSAWLAGQ